ncbi:type II toxin-antitoxin system RelE/ParE family toxin [Burkholderia pyrrocinia]|uniref:Type II toxin-antitoxin system RelE/ParE family toxin n=1 Tax=Burkholderia pyrrocinia TaxID=60550 RepID=A0ABZ3BNP1_BURPY
MNLKWSDKAFSDLMLIHEVLAMVDPHLAARAVQVLAEIPTSLRVNSRIGERLVEFSPSDVRRLVVGKYEVRYEIREAAIYVLRLCRTREQ